MELGIQGKTALVTGADSGIGFATALELLKEGAQVVMTDQYPESLEKAVLKIDNYSEQVFSYPADITNKEDLKKLHEKVKAEVGKIDILVQSAGITGDQGLLHDIIVYMWISMIDVDILDLVSFVN